ncbi:MAG: hypothetical protein COS68_02815, partial [Elusimicrobia bacterium CG06_land_8_20_14_3_00_38_11]
MLIKKIGEVPVRYLIDKTYRITVYSTSLVRIEYSKKGVFDDEEPLILEPALAMKEKNLSCEIKTVKDFFILSTDYFELKLKADGNRFDIGSLYFTIKEKKYTWQPGIIDEQNLGGAMLDLYKFPEGKSNEKFTEGLISKNGYFVFRNHCEFLWDNKKNWFKRKRDWDSQDWYLFGYGSDYKKAFSDFVSVFGKIPLPPKWAFGYWYSKWYKFKDVEILDVVKKLKEKKIPLDVFVIDTDWRKNVWNGYEWNKELFPNPKALLDELKRQNIHTCLNDHPGYGQSDELPQDDPYREKIKVKIPDITDYRIQWSDERYVSAWLDEIFVQFLKEGIDFWWVDGWGATGGIMDFSSQLWLNKWYFEAAKMAGDNRRPMLLSRWGGIGSHKYPVQFSGDTHSSFETLKYEISFTHKGGNIGASYWSHDIGGFLGEKLPEELYIRWIQFGCFSPVFRTHSSKETRNPLDYSERALEIFTKYLKVRYSLFPYFYKLARECFDTGLPLIRGLYLEEPGDKNACIYDEEYLIGKSLLVAPAYGPGKVFQRDVYFPKGVWISLEGKEVVKGPCKKKIKIPLDKIPVYVKSGSIIPTIPVKQNLSEKITELELSVYADTRNEFLYYEDDGLTEDYRNGGFITQKVEVSKIKNKIILDLFPVSGDYRGFKSEIQLNLNVFIGDAAVTSIFIDDAQKIPSYTKRLFSET